ncbi:MAG: hypothetical protein ABIQ58_05625 [Candidatus Limnocylindrales bacterium]
MSEILTESFCERCGTRYTFESAAPRTAKLKGIRVLSRGLKNFVMSDDTSMDEAMAAARSETDREVTSHQLDAFHKTFNFCMTCRQYTCGNCWNEAEGFCLTCAPHLGHEILPAPFPAMDAHPGIALGNGIGGTNGHAVADNGNTLAWPSMDLERDLEDAAAFDASEMPPIDAAARLVALGAIDEPVGPTEPADGAARAEDPGAEHAHQAAQEPPARSATAIDPSDVTGRAAAAAEQTTDLLRRFRAGQDLDDEIAAFESGRADGELEPAGAVEQAEAEAVAQARAVEQAEAVAQARAVEQAEAEAVAQAQAVDQAEAVAQAEAELAAAAAHDDLIRQPTWQIVAPDAVPPAPVEGPSPTAAPPAPPSTNGPIPVQTEQQWPTQPEWPSQRTASAGLPFLGRLAQPTGTLESLWAESAREVASAPMSLTPGAAPARGAAGGVQPCVSCGLSLSATARFCRRCGTPQG